MTSPICRATSRRRFLEFLAASPLCFLPGRLKAEGLGAPAKPPDPIIWGPQTLDRFIKDPKEAITLFDFEPAAKLQVPPAHFGYMASGIDDEVTSRANRADFLRYQLRPRRLHDVSSTTRPLRPSCDRGHTSRGSTSGEPRRRMSYQRPAHARYDQYEDCN